MLGKHDLWMCVKCRRDVRLRVSDDIGFHFHWVDDWYFVDVVLFLYDIGAGLVLWREMWRVGG